MRAKHFLCFNNKKNLGRTVGTSKMHLSPQELRMMSKVVVLLLLIHFFCCSYCFCEFCFGAAVLSVLSSFAIILNHWEERAG